MNANSVTLTNSAPIVNPFEVRPVRPAQLPLERIFRCGLYVRAKDVAAINSQFVRLAKLLEYKRRTSNDIWEVVGQYVDEPRRRNGTPPPGLKRLLDDIDDDLVNCLVVCTMDRLARAYDDYWLSRSLEARGVSIVCEPWPRPY